MEPLPNRIVGPVNALAFVGAGVGANVTVTVGAVALGPLDGAEGPAAALVRPAACPGGGPGAGPPPTIAAVTACASANGFVTVAEPRP